MQSLENNVFYLDEIFEKNNGNMKYTKDAELFQDILRYFKIEVVKVERNNGDLDNEKGLSLSLRTQPEAFTIRDLEKWLMRKNRHFLDKYSGLKGKTSMVTRIANNDKHIKNSLKKLESINLIHVKDHIQGQKNKILTPRYKLTIHGIFLLIILNYESGQFSKDKDIINKTIISYIQQEWLRPYNSHICDFLSNFYNEIYMKGYLQLFVDKFIQVLDSFSNTIKTILHALNLTLHSLLMSKETYDIFNKLYVNTINKLDDNVKKIILFLEKGDIESRIHLAQPPKDWEILWIENLQNYSMLTLYGKCKRCHEKYPTLVDYFHYRNNILSSNILIKKCNKCNSENSLIVSWDLSKII